jgi:hypothetical protein
MPLGQLDMWDLHNLFAKYSYNNQIEDRMSKAYNKYRRGQKCKQSFDTKTQGKETTRNRKDGNIKMDLEETG